MTDIKVIAYFLGGGGNMGGSLKAINAVTVNFMTEVKMINEDYDNRVVKSYSIAEVQQIADELSELRSFLKSLHFDISILRDEVLNGQVDINSFHKLSKKIERELIK